MTSLKDKTVPFKELDEGMWFIFKDPATADRLSPRDPHKYIKLSDRRFVTAHEYEPRIKIGKNPRKSVVRQIGSINTLVIVQPLGWG